MRSLLQKKGKRMKRKEDNNSSFNFSPQFIFKIYLKTYRIQTHAGMVCTVESPLHS